MKKRIFNNPLPTTKKEALKIFCTGSESEICNALVAIALNEDEDWQWVQDQCLHFLRHSDSSNIRGLAATCLGHIARIHGKLDREIVVSTLKEFSKVEKISGQIENALDDIDMFMPNCNTEKI